MKRLTQIGLLLALCAAFAPKSQAREITFLFTGTVTRLETKDVEDLPNYVAIGDPIVGSFTFESDTLGDESNPPDVIYDAITAGSFTVGELAGAGTSGAIGVINDYLYESDPPMMATLCISRSPSLLTSARRCTTASVWVSMTPLVRCSAVPPCRPHLRAC